mgnify:CR=1 FL=1
MWPCVVWVKGLLDDTTVLASLYVGQVTSFLAMPAEGTEEMAWVTLSQTTSLADTTQAKLNYAYANRVAMGFHIDIRVR